MAHSRDFGKERRWLDLIRAWQQSGLSVREFCGRRRLRKPSFYLWRRVLRQRGLLDDTADTSTPPAAFLQVALPAHAAQSQPGIDIVLANGKLLRVHPGFDPDTLRQVLRLLEEPSC